MTSAKRDRIDVDALKDRITLEQVVEAHGVTLKRAGKELEALCPFHTEKTPSFKITPAKQIYYCAGCAAGGDSIRFIMDYHGMGFRDAAERLAEMAGGGLPANDNTPGQRASNRKEPAPPKWIKDTAPTNAPAPPEKLRVLRGGDWLNAPIVSRWPYRTSTGELIGYTCRIEFPKEGGGISKDVIPLTWQVNTDTGEATWRQGAFPEPRPLYGAELLDQHPDAPVILVEGEKACDAARRMTEADGALVLTWAGGCKAVDKSDWSVLAGREYVAGWPDTDAQSDRDGVIRPYLQQPGMAAMLRIAEILEGHGVEMLVAEIDQPGVRVDGWDAADAEAEGWDGQAVQQFIVDRAMTPGELRAHAAQVEIDAARDLENMPEHSFDDAEHRFEDLGEPEDPKPAGKSKAKAKDEKPKRPPPGPEDLRDDMPVRALGYRRGHYYYLSARQRQVHEYSAGAHGPTGMMQLAPLSFWSNTFAYGDTMKRDHWQAATDALMRKCEMVGIFDTEVIRGRGCWIDDGRMVLNLGNRILVDGVQTDSDRVGGEFIYEHDTKLPGPKGDPLTAKEAQRIIEIAKRFNWEMPASAALLAGWVVLAPICGALRWRPHIWISGGTGTGKTTILNQFMVPMLAGMDLKVQGNSTEAGIRQRLRADARPVIFDESEQNDEREASRIQNVLALVRQSSSDSDFKTLKGTTSGSSLEFHIRSMFCLASIQVGIKQQADHTRIAVLGLYGTSQVAPDQVDSHHEKWLETERMLAELRDDHEFGARLVQRSVQMVDVIRANMRTMVRVAALEFRSQRLADTYGTLLGGATALFYDHAISDETAAKFIRMFDWAAYHEAAREDESCDALTAMMQIEIRCERERGAITLTTGELVSIVFNNKSLDGVMPGEAVGHLGRLGLKVKRGIVGKDAGLLVANKSERLQKSLRGAAWAADWRSYIRRLPGAKAHAIPITFAPGYSARATFVPIEQVLKDDGEA